MKKIRFLLAGLLFLLLGFTGCTKDYDQSDIKDYVREQLKLKQFKISNSYEEAEGSDGYTDRFWTVVDKGTGVTFRVQDDYYYGMESTANRLRNDYNATVYLSMEQELPESDLIDRGNLVIHTEPDEDGMNQVYMVGYFGSKAELEEIIRFLDSYAAFFQKRGVPDLDIALYLNVMGPETYPYRKHLIGGECVVGLHTDRDEIRRLALADYALCALDYQFQDMLDEMEPEELQAVLLADRTDRVGIVQEDGTTVYYEDLIGNEYSYGLSISTLYLVLEREGLEPEGNQMHFTCTGVDGVVYEFSYDFCSELIDGDTCAYYLADGEIVSMGYEYNSHINAYKTSQLFGLNVVTKWNRTIAEEAEKEETEKEETESEITE